MVASEYHAKVGFTCECSGLVLRISRYAEGPSTCQISTLSGSACLSSPPGCVRLHKGRVYLGLLFCKFQGAQKGPAPAKLGHCRGGSVHSALVCLVIRVGFIVLSLYLLYYCIYYCFWGTWKLPSVSEGVAPRVRGLDWECLLVGG
jgi:hypothetical protein